MPFKAEIFFLEVPLKLLTVIYNPWNNNNKKVILSLSLQKSFFFFSKKQNKTKNKPQDHGVICQLHIQMFHLILYDTEVTK